MYGSFEDFARYANDREMDYFGTQEFFDYHNAKREEVAVPADAAQPVETSIAPTGEGVNVAARDAGAVSDAADPFAAAKRVTDISGLKPVPQHGVSEWKPTNPREAYAEWLREAFIATGLVDERSAARLSDTVMGTQERLGLGHFEPVALYTEGSQTLARGIETGDKMAMVFGAMDMLTAGLPVYGKTMTQTARQLIKGVEKKFGKRPAIDAANATKLDAASGSLEVRQSTPGYEPTGGIANETVRQVPGTSATKTFDADRLADLRSKAAKIESPERGITLYITEDGRAVLSGPPRVKIPARFERFAKENNLDFRVIRHSDSNYSKPMPIEYRTSGALYSHESIDINGGSNNRTGGTRF